MRPGQPTVRTSHESHSSSSATTRRWNGRWKVRRPTGPLGPNFLVHDLGAIQVVLLDEVPRIRRHLRFHERSEGRPSSDVDGDQAILPHRLGAARPLRLASSWHLTLWHPGWCPAAVGLRIVRPSDLLTIRTVWYSWRARSNCPRRLVPVRFVLRNIHHRTCTCSHAH